MRRVVGDIISAAGVMGAFDDDLPTVVRREITRLKGTHWKDEQGQWVLSDEQAIRADERERWAKWHEARRKMHKELAVGDRAGEESLHHDMADMHEFSRDAIDRNDHTAAALEGGALPAGYEWSGEP